jgi:hypothetical protein
LRAGSPVIRSKDEDHYEHCPCSRSLGGGPRSADENAAILEEAARKRRHKALGEYLDEWEAEHGAFTEEELAETAEKMGWPWPPEGEVGK